MKYRFAAWPTKMINCRCYRFVLALATALACCGNSTHAEEETLESHLKREPVAALAAEARASGDAVRGAIAFHQAHATCAKCHAVDGSAGALGPDLARFPERPSDEHLVESVLDPSKQIRDAYRPLKVVTTDGVSITGLLAEETPEALTLRDLAQAGKRVVIRRADIESRAASDQSPMPSGLVNQLASRQQFLDLVRYLIEIRDGGLDRARQLQPSPALIALQIPEYESRVDHAGILRSLDGAALDRGKAIYQRLCVNCHGTHDQAGSLPTSPRFAKDKLKSGSDPFSMYQTLTRGFGLMAPQTWMVPQQKYDVIHYIREEYFRGHNPSQHAAITADYLARLPKGDTRGPPPQKTEPWRTMNYGPALVNTYEIGSDGRNFAYKGIAVRLDGGPGGVARGRAWMVFDHDTLRVAAAWTGEGFVDWNGIHFNGQHNAHPRIVGDVHLANPTGPGWSDPATGSFEDNRRVVGRDQRRYGPLPRAWAKYGGLYYHNDKAVISYTVGDTEVLESPGVVLPENADGATIFTRTMNVGPRASDLTLLVATGGGENLKLTPTAAGVRFEPADARSSGTSLYAALSAPLPGVTWGVEGPRLCLRIPAGKERLRFVVGTARTGDDAAIDGWASELAERDRAPDLQELTQGGPPRWPEKLTTQAVLGSDAGPFAVDVLTHPERNPWLAQVRFTGIDFLPGGDGAVVCAWDGDVWLVQGLLGLARENAASGSAATLSWQRIATGLFQPLGVKVTRGRIYVTCRDQLAVLHDANGDAEVDHIECFNNDHQVTEHFHEFAMGLQTDAAGNFYYAKSARHALPALVPHHGTLLRISPDGKRTDILATGFRAANGVCLNPDGTFVVTDQEGHWNPKNRINWVTPGGFYGNMFGYHDVTDSSDAAMRQPLCWITNAFDRSPAELLWTPKDAWGPLGGSLLNLSYGYGKVFVVPFEDVAGQKQGGMCELPIAALPTGIMRGRFHPADRQLYTCGMFAWAGSVTQPGGLYRIRYTGKPMHLPVGLKAQAGHIAITWTDPIDAEAARDVKRYAIKTWSLRRTANYGSQHYDEKPLPITAVEVSSDRRTVTLAVAELKPTWCMEIVCRLQDTAGNSFERKIHNSVHAFGGGHQQGSVQEIP